MAMMRMNPHARGNAGANLATWALALPALAELNRVGIPIIVFKSLPQLEDLYGELGIRLSQDLDILVRGKDCEAALTAILRLPGWELLCPQEFELLRERLGAGAAAASRPWNLRNRAGDLTTYVDLHPDSLPLPNHPSLSSGVWQRASLNVRDSVEFYELSVEDRLVFLCWHAVQHRLEMQHLIDVERAISKDPQLDWSLVGCLAARSGLCGMVRYVCDSLGEESKKHLPQDWSAVGFPHMKLHQRVVVSICRGAPHRFSQVEKQVLLVALHDRGSAALSVARQLIAPDRLGVGVELGFWPSWTVYWAFVLRSIPPRVRAFPERIRRVSTSTLSPEK
jgi:hypothetical protein